MLSLDSEPRHRSHCLLTHVPEADDLAHLLLSICWASGWAPFLTHFLQQSLSWIHILPLDQFLQVLRDSQSWLTVAGILMREVLIYRSPDVSPLD